MNTVSKSKCGKLHFDVLVLMNVLSIVCGLVFLRIVQTRTDERTGTALSCYDGSYAVTIPPFGPCSGFRSCEPGSFCLNGVKELCPAGQFGDRPGLNSSLCSGKCPPGFYCPLGTADPQTNMCGDASLYCPEGSGVPLHVREGYYTIDSTGSDDVNSARTRAREIICPRGYYCTAGIKQHCPGGTYGLSEGLSSETCSGPCPEGWYCPPGSIQPYEFSCASSPDANGEHTANVYCPEGSARPIPTAEGYYAILPHFEQGGGYGGQLKCPRGSYCLKGLRHLCPAGRYGVHTREINASCTGLCTAGYYCPPGSVLDQQIRCPDAASFCPTGSAEPIPVSPGHYTIGHDPTNYTFDIANYGASPFAETARTNQSICEPGFYCLSDGIKRKCPVGRYGSTFGLSSPSCSGYCAAGYYCEEGSPTATQYKCGGADRFCPPGSTIAQLVHNGYYTVSLVDGDPARAAEERRCEPGFYCHKGIKRLCDPGTWGGTFGLNQSQCSGPCDPGFYCPEGSVSPTEKLCGDADKYCPRGSYKPTMVSPGYFSIGGNVSSRVTQEQAPPGHYAFNGMLYVCPAGYYGAVPGLTSSTCSGACSIPGYYCPAGSTSPLMRFCGGDDVFCPPFTVAPVKVHSGFYTADYIYEVCPPGQWRNQTIFLKSNDATGNSAIVTQQPLWDCQLCPNGTYKAVAGDPFSLCLPCDTAQSYSSPDHSTCDCVTAMPVGYTARFNITTGRCQRYRTSDVVLIDASMWATNTSLTRFQQFPCEPGHYCAKGLRYKCPPGRYGALTQETRPLCEGVCTQGYYCLQSSTSPMSYPCGAAKYICPEGSYAPTLVPAGYYSNEDGPEELRYSQNICPLGYYCPGDGRRYPCSKGTYTNREGTVDSFCMGPCEKGHYCLEASPSSTQFRCGNTSVYCPRGSFEPTRIHEGFYGLFTGTDAGEEGFWSADNSTYSVEIPCEPGYYCSGGVKRACPPGTFGWRYGMTNAQCGGQCAPGYYCPSYMTPQPDAAPYTVWPGAPHLTATDLECGDVKYYCPRGAFYPLLVGGGNYSIGGSAHNRTRTAQAICPPGSYCEGAIPILCPMGRYGNRPGLSDSSCAGPCPPGFYCPGGTVDPVPCAPTEYSTGIVAVCSKCPGDRTTPLLCQHEKGCCFRG